MDDTVPAMAQWTPLMKYVDGYLIPVPVHHKAAYLEMAARAAAVLKELGATRVVEAWGDDLPKGKVTDFKKAVKARRDECVVFSWVEYPSKAVRDAALKRMRDDPRLLPDGPLPFDGQRMFWGGFAPLLDT